VILSLIFDTSRLGGDWVKEATFASYKWDGSKKDKSHLFPEGNLIDGSSAFGRFRFCHFKRN